MTTDVVDDDEEVVGDSFGREVVVVFFFRGLLDFVFFVGFEGICVGGIENISFRVEYLFELIESTKT